MLFCVVPDVLDCDFKLLYVFFSYKCYTLTLVYLSIFFFFWTFNIDCRNLWNVPHGAQSINWAKQHQFDNWQYSHQHLQKQLVGSIISVLYCSKFFSLHLCVSVLKFTFQFTFFLLISYSTINDGHNMNTMVRYLVIYVLCCSPLHEGDNMHPLSHWRNMDMPR